MKINKMKDITIKLLDENKKEICSEHFELSRDGFEKRFHENFYDIIRTFVRRAEDDFNLAVNYQIVMEVKDN